MCKEMFAGRVLREQGCCRNCERDVVVSHQAFFILHARAALDGRRDCPAPATPGCKFCASRQSIK